MVPVLSPQLALEFSSQFFSWHFKMCFSFTFCFNLCGCHHGYGYGSKGLFPFAQVRCPSCLWLLKITALFTNMQILKFKSHLHNCVFLLPSIIITITSKEPWNTKTHKTDRNPPITNHKPWPFQPVKVKFCFLRGPLSWLTAAKNTIVSWLSNFTIRMFVKSAVNWRPLD